MSPIRPGWFGYVRSGARVRTGWGRWEQRSLPVIRMKRCLTLIAALSAGVVLAACGTGGGESSSAVTSGALTPGQQVSGEIDFWHAYSDSGPEVKALTEQVIPAFEKAHPGTKINPVTVQYNQLHQKLVTAAAGEQLPCLVRSDIVWVPELAGLGVLEPLSESMADFQQLADATYPGPLATNKWKDAYYGLPLDTNTKVLLYNQSALDAAGVKVPATFDDLKADAGAFAGTGKYLLAEGGSAGWQILPYIWSGGGEMTDANITTADGYLNGPKSVAAIQMLVDMYQAGQLPGLVLGGEGQTPTSDGLAQGLYATIVDGPWVPQLLADSDQYKDFKVGFAPMPDGGGGSISVVGGENVVMTKSCQNKELAAEFARYLLSDDAQLAMAKTGQLSVLSALGEQMTSINPNYAEYIDQLKTARPRPPTPQWSKIDDILTKQVQAAFQGQLSVQAALDQAVAQIDPLLAKS